ncbi:hypothetical protein [Spiroplasma endosymbiont of Aspidapion aeneum]|uniref:hypothetical protein n=1 Tax=Spiroplasma endosymbiont of Aspidapion aeneum TaxID=3066276 RepID=UPI00313CB72B
MKAYEQIMSELGANGYNWVPQNFKNLDEKIWIRMGEYFNESEVVLSALWCSFEDADGKKNGIIFITSERSFVLDVNDTTNSVKIKYTPYNIFSSTKCQTQFSSTTKGMNYISLDIQGYQDLRTYECPNKLVAKHFIDTLLNRVSDIDYEELPESDDPLISENKKEQLIDEELEKVKEQFDHNFKEKNPDEIDYEDSPLWNKAPAENYEKEVEIKTVPIKEMVKQPNSRPKKEVSELYASKMRSKIWCIWFIIPILILTIMLVAIFLK